MRSRCLTASRALCPLTYFGAVVTALAMMWWNAAALWRGRRRS